MIGNPICILCRVDVTTCGHGPAPKFHRPKHAPLMFRGNAVPLNADLGEMLRASLENTNRG